MLQAIDIQCVVMNKNEDIEADILAAKDGGESPALMEPRPPALSR
jgi:hypothetical protein